MGECMKNSARGYIFSADIILAVIIFVLLFGAMQYSLTEPTASGVEVLQLRQILDDVLSLLDRDGTLQTFNTSTIATVIDDALPINYDHKAVLQKWTLAGSAFTLSETKEFGNTAEDLTEKEFVKGRRIFTKLSATGIDSYYNLEYWAWIK